MITVALASIERCELEEVMRKDFRVTNVDGSGSGRFLPGWGRPGNGGTIQS